jgi:hypothetical protein
LQSHLYGAGGGGEIYAAELGSFGRIGMGHSNQLHKGVCRAHFSGVRVRPNALPVTASHSGGSLLSDPARTRART